MKPPKIYELTKIAALLYDKVGEQAEAPPPKRHEKAAKEALQLWNSCQKLLHKSFPIEHIDKARIKQLALEPDDSYTEFWRSVGSIHFMDEFERDECFTYAELVDALWPNYPPKKQYEELARVIKDGKLNDIRLRPYNEIISKKPGGGQNFRVSDCNVISNRKQKLISEKRKASSKAGVERKKSIKTNNKE